MEPLERREALDRHALVMAIWLSLGFVAVTLLKYGLGPGGNWFILSGFGVLIAAFIGHIVINAVYRTTFSPRELALGLVVYAAALVMFGFSVLLSASLRDSTVVTLGIGFVAVFVVVVFYMIIHFGVRRAFEAFDVIRDFRSKF